MFPAGGKSLRHCEDLVVKICEVLKHFGPSTELDRPEGMGEFESRIWDAYLIDLQWSPSKGAIRLGFVTEDHCALGVEVVLEELVQAGPSYIDAMMNGVQDAIDHHREQRTRIILPTAIARELGREQQPAQAPPRVLH